MNQFEVVATGDDSEEDVEFEEESFEIGGHTYYLTTVSYMPLTKLASLVKSSSEISGQKLWCGSLVVAQYFINIRLSLPLSDWNVIELGAGTGLAGMICKRLGVKEVILTDHDETSLNHMKRDSSRNNLDVMVEKLDWYDDSGVSELRNLEGDTVIIAGDVLYKGSLIRPFFSTVKRLFMKMSAFESRLLFCHVPRADVDHCDVLNEVTRCGFTCEVIPSFQWKEGINYTYSSSEEYDRAQLYMIRN